MQTFFYSGLDLLKTLVIYDVFCLYFAKLAELRVNECLICYWVGLFLEGT